METAEISFLFYITSNWELLNHSSSDVFVGCWIIEYYVVVPLMAIVMVMMNAISRSSCLYYTLEDGKTL